MLDCVECSLAGIAEHDSAMHRIHGAFVLCTVQDCTPLMMVLLACGNVSGGSAGASAHCTLADRCGNIPAIKLWSAKGIRAAIHS
mgnify:CR=1 FL=1